jgi:hypothetical protein
MTGQMRALTISSQPQRLQTWLAPSDSYLLVNTDITNQIFVGNDPGTQPVPVPPLGSIAVGADNSHDTWVSTGSASYTVQALLLPNGTQWTPSPAQVAAQISALGLATATNQSTQITQGTTLATNQGTQIAQGTTLNNSVNATPNSTAALIATGSAAGTPGGVPLLRYTNQLGNGSGKTLAGAASVNLITTMAINQPGYEMTITCNMPASSGTIPFASLVFNWIDSVTGIAVKSAYFIVTAGNGPSNALQFYINGPSYGDQLTVQLTNLDPSITLTYTWVLNQTSHVHLVDNIIQPAYAATGPNGFSNPGGTPGLGMLAIAHPSVGFGTNLDRLLAVYSGKIQLTIDNTGNSSAMTVALDDPTGSLYSNIATQVGVIQNIAAGGEYTVEVALPHGPMLLRLHNAGTSGSITPGVIIVCKDY